MTLSEALARVMKAKKANPEAPAPGGRTFGWARGWLVAAAVLAAVGLVVGVLASTSGAGSSSNNERADIGATARVGSGEPECAKPTGQSVQAVGATGTSASTTALLGGEEGGNVFLTLLGEGALHFGEDEGLGYLLKVITGEQGLDPAQIDQQFDMVNTKLDALAEQQYQDCTALLSALAAVKTNDDKNAYDGLVSGMADQTGLIVTYQQDFDNVVAALGRNGGDVNALNSSYKDDLKDMISGGPDGLRNVINTINTRQVASSPGAKAMVLYFSQILTDQLGYDPYQTHIYPAAYVDGAYAQQDYYAALVDQAAYLYTNVEHLNFTDGSYTHTADADSNADVVSLVNAAQADIQSWSTTSSDGPAGDWVSQGVHQGIGAIPADTVLDYRIQNHPLLWTDSPVGLNGDPASPAPYYCATTAQFCYADRYNSAGQVAATSLVRPSPQPLTTMIAADHDGGLSGWRMPTMTDWNDLQAGATGGLSTWGAAHQLGPFTAETLTSHAGGKDQTLTTIAPVLVNTGTADAPSIHELSSGAATVDNTLSLEQPPFAVAAGGQSDSAGRLFLVQDFQPVPAPKPFTTDQVNSSRPAAATLTTAAPAAANGLTATTGQAATTAAKVTASLAPKDFSTPTTCSAANAFVVPDGVGSVTITAVGGAGAAGTTANNATAPGGVGGSVTATYPVTAGDTLYVQVGGAGTSGINQPGGNGRGGVGGGGNGGVTHSSYKGAGEYSGGGGGASGVSTTPNCSQWLVVAGGGGGGGAGHKVNATLTYNGGRGGNGCASLPGSCAPAGTGSYLAPYVAEAGGAGGAQPDNHGGAAGSAAGGAGGNLQGGNGAESGSGGVAQGDGGGGGGGGAGYFGGGGGGGGGHSAGGGGGGGGASFAISGGSGPSYGLGAAGQNGTVTITPVAKPQVPISLSVQATAVTWGQADRLTATLPADAVGDIGFYDSQVGGLGVAPIRNGVATLPSPNRQLSIGSHSLTASFGGDDHYAANDTGPIVITVSKATPTMNLTISGTVLPSGQAPKSLVVQMPTDATGTVGFYNDINGGCDGKTGPGAACEAVGTSSIQNGYATLTTLTVPLAAGKNYLHASYDGDSHYQPNDSNVVTVTLSP